MLRAKIFFEQRMPRFDEFERVVVCDLGHDGVEFSCKFDFGFYEIEFGDGFDGGLDSRELLAKHSR